MVVYLMNYSVLLCQERLPILIPMSAACPSQNGGDEEPLPSPLPAEKTLPNTEYWVEYASRKKLTVEEVFQVMHPLTPMGNIILEYLDAATYLALITGTYPHKRGSPDKTFVLDKHGTYMMEIPRQGVPRSYKGDIRGKHVVEVLPHPIGERLLKEMYRAMETGETLSMIFNLRMQNGDKASVFIEIQPQEDKGCLIFAWDKIN